MKLGVYTIVNTPLPKLLKIKTINVNIEDFEYIENIVNILNNKLSMDKLDSEFIYALSLTYGLIPRGIILIGVGNNQSATENLRGLGIGLLLTGAEQFMVFHNHPGGNKKPSKEDYGMTELYKILGQSIGVEFYKHIMITQNYYEEC